LRGVSGAEMRASGTSAHIIVGDGSGFALKFYAKDQHAVFSALVGLSYMSAVDEHGLVANPIADATGTVLIHDANPPVPAEVTIRASDVSVETRKNFSVPIAVTSSKALTNLGVTVSWDVNVLEWRGVTGATAKDGDAALTTGKARLEVSENITQPILITFHAKDQHTVTQTTIGLSEGVAWCGEGLAANVTLAEGKVAITDSNPPVAPSMAISIINARAESGQAFVVPLGTLTDGDLAELSVTIAWDSSKLTFNGCEGASSVTLLGADSSVLTFSASGTDNRYTLNFTAAKIASLREESWVRLTAASGVGANGLAAKVTTSLPRTAEVLIVREIGKYDPGDINGDGKYTEADLTALKNYFVYQEIVKALGANSQAARNKASYKLTGRALTAADVNCDGKVDANDISMLTQFIIQAQEAAK